MVSELVAAVLLLAAAMAGLITGAVSLRYLTRGNGANAVNLKNIMRELGECIERRERLEHEIEQLKEELARLRQKLAETEAELEALRRAFSRFVVSGELPATPPKKPAYKPISTDDPVVLLEEERAQLQQNIARLHVLIARRGEKLELLNELERSERRLREVEKEIDNLRARGAPQEEQ